MPQNVQDFLHAAGVMAGTGANLLSLSSARPCCWSGSVSHGSLMEKATSMSFPRCWQAWMSLRGERSRTWPPARAASQCGRDGHIANGACRARAEDHGGCEQKEHFPWECTEPLWVLTRAGSIPRAHRSPLKGSEWVSMRRTGCGVLLWGIE